MSVPAGTRFIGIQPGVDMVERKSSQANSPTEVYTIDEIQSSNSGLFAQTSTSPVVTGTTESTLIDGGVGTLTIPANGFSVGDSFVAVLTGHISCDNNEGFRIRVKAGSVILVDSGVFSIAATTAKHWKLEVNFTIRSLGAAGVASVASGGYFMYNRNNVQLEGINFSTENNTTFATDVSNTLNITGQWSTANPNNTIYSELFTLTRVK